MINCTITALFTAGKMTRCAIFLFTFLLISCQQPECKAQIFAAIIGIYEAIKEAVAVYEDLKEIYDAGKEFHESVKGIIEEPTESEDHDKKEIPEELLHRLTDIQRGLSDMRVDISRIEDELLGIDQSITRHIQQDTLIREMLGIIDDIETQYDTFVHVFSNVSFFTSDTMMLLMKDNINPAHNGFFRLAGKLHAKFSKRFLNLYSLDFNKKEEYEQMCRDSNSLQQTIYYLYSQVALADIKTFAMVAFSLDRHKADTCDHRKTSDVALVKKQFKNRMSNTLNAVRYKISSLSRTLMNCQKPSKENPVRFKHLFRRFLAYPSDMDPSASCKDNCGDYSEAKWTKQTNYKDLICRGTLWDCQSTSGKVEICFSREGDRTYDYLKISDNSTEYGKACAAPIHRTDDCLLCNCLCDYIDEENSDRFVDLRAVEADEKHVVTGVRLQKKNGLLYLEIQQGILQSGATIRTAGSTWKEREVSAPALYIKEGRIELDSDYKEDFYVLQWKNYDEAEDISKAHRNGAFRLDDIDFSLKNNSQDYVMTGIKFSADRIDDLGTHIHIAVKMSRFDFCTGMIDLDDSIWHSRFGSDEDGGHEQVVFHDTGKGVVEIDVYNKQLPTEVSEPLSEQSNPGNYLFLTTSSMEKDVGQTTIPYIDDTDVAPKVSVPLSGAGLYLKGSPSSGGYLALKVFTYDYYQPILSETKCKISRKKPLRRGNTIGASAVRD